MKKIIHLLMLTAVISCNKKDFLDAKPDASLVVPSTIKDYQAILDNDVNMNGEFSYGIVPELGETGADNYYLSADNYNGYLNPLYQRCYRWDKDVFTNEQIVDWNLPYESIYYTNVVLDGLQNITPDSGNITAFKNAEGSALFYRAHLFYQLVQVFAAPYNKDSAAALPGIPLRTTSSVTAKINRASLQDTYSKIVTDLKMAATELPAKASYATQPSERACYGMLARVYLTMEDYDSALIYANACLQLDNTLIDYNTVDSTSQFPFTVFNAEDIFQCEMIGGPDNIPVNPYLAFVDTNLYKSFQNNDLRSTLFFKPNGNDHFFSGSYSGAFQLFAGIATDEIYLIKAECEARKDQASAALEDLNSLLEKRYLAGTYQAYTLNNTPSVLNLVLTERRKELCFRGLRWTDLRRLNKEGFNIILKRLLDGTSYTLPPNNSRYIYPIPQPVINFNPGMQQNIRN